jgi:hypothetical protein
MTRALVLVALVAVLPVVAGCVLEPATPIETAGGEPASAPSVVEHQLTVASEDGLSALPAPRADGLDPIPFQIGAGYGALSRVDLQACRDRGLQSGYVRLRATFTRVGYVVRASVESAAAQPAPALDCIADHLRQTGVPAFDGQDARLSRTYFVAPADARSGPDEGD